MTVPDSVAILTGGTAVCALGLSIYNTITQRLSERPRASVAISFGLTTPDATIVVILQMANRGKTDIYFVSCGLTLPGPNTVPFMAPRELPKTLRPGHGVSEVQPLEELKDSMRCHGYTGKVAIFGWATDGVGERHTSKKPLEISLDE